MWCYGTKRDVLGGNGDNGVGNFLAQVGLSGLLHFTEDHGGGFFRTEGSFFTLEFDLEHGFISLFDDLERVEFHVTLYIGVVKFTANQSFGIVDGAG